MAFRVAFSAALLALGLQAVCVAPLGASEEAVQSSFDLSGLTPEDQTPTGKFTTAAEISMILDATQNSWVAVREYNGQDLVYFSHIFAWRCGLKAMKFAINEGALQNFDLPECHMKYQQPNALLETDPLPYITQGLGSVRSLRVDLLLDDLTEKSITVQRENVLIP